MRSKAAVLCHLEAAYLPPVSVLSRMVASTVRLKPESLFSLSLTSMLIASLDVLLP